MNQNHTLSTLLFLVFVATSACVIPAEGTGTVRHIINEVGHHHGGDASLHKRPASSTTSSSSSSSSSQHRQSRLVEVATLPPYTHTPLPPEPANVSTCPRGMVQIAGSFCIDQFEAPNIRNWRPLAFQNGIDAEYWCSQVGKALCTERQWDRTCQGASGRKFPYGNTYNVSACNANKTWIPPNWAKLNEYPEPEAMMEAARLYQADNSGANEECVSEEGAYDLTGNVAEWVRRDLSHERDPYNHVMKGCYWAGCFGGEPASCGFTNPAHPAAFREYPTGFRCCVWLK